MTAKTKTTETPKPRLKPAQKERTMTAKTKTTETPKPRLKLTGQDGNAFMMLGLAHRAARKAGWDDARWNAVKREAMGGDYDHLLTTLMEHFDVD